jgi:hypothetical protein
MGGELKEFHDWLARVQCAPPALVGPGGRDAAMEMRRVSTEELLSMYPRVTDELRRRLQEDNPAGEYYVNLATWQKQQQYPGLGRA